jgi:regulator of protease activity HflC (stomatin/prohibitin superfamily)
MQLMGHFLNLPVLFFLVLFALFMVSALRVVNDEERGVILRLGRVIGMKGPGLILIIPFVDRMHRVDVSVLNPKIPSQKVSTKDGVAVKVNALISFRVSDAVAATVQMEDYHLAAHTLAQTVLRKAVSQSYRCDLLSPRADIERKFHETLKESSELWGIKMLSVEYKHVELI